MRKIPKESSIIK